MGEVWRKQVVYQFNKDRVFIFEPTCDFCIIWTPGLAHNCQTLSSVTSRDDTHEEYIIVDYQSGGNTDINKNGKILKRT